MAKSLNFVTPDDVETQQFDWGTFQWMNAPKVTGTGNMVMGVGHVYPGKGHERHNHPEGEEFIYFMSGTSEQMVELPDGQQKKIMHPGDIIFVPKGAFHFTYNVGKDEVTIIACYQFAGPEEFLGSLAQKIIPAKNKRG